MKQPAVLEAIGISKRYGHREVLSSVDLAAEPGQLHGLIGPNGAGKTTLMRILLGLVQRDAGTVRFFGRAMGSTGEALPTASPGQSRRPRSIPTCPGRRTSRSSAVSTV